MVHAVHDRLARVGRSEVRLWNVDIAQLEQNMVIAERTKMMRPPSAVGYRRERVEAAG